MTCVSVLGKATKSKDKNSRLLAEEELSFFFLRDERLTVTCGCDDGTLSLLVDCKRVLIIFEEENISRPCIFQKTVISFEYI